MNMKLNSTNIGVIGLGYVGLPLAIEFSYKFPVIGFDINANRILDLNSGVDSTNEVEIKNLKKANNIIFTSDAGSLKSCNFYIITVPTPINKNKRPDLGPLINASNLIATVLKKGDVVVYESTVYPGATEEDCVPILENISGLSLNKDFYAGYSPERINPGDKTHRLPHIKKVTSGSNKRSAEFIDQVYKKIILAGTHKAESIKVAEAAKVIENTQRDLNIALINELALIFKKLDIDTEAVLEAAGTKWNFLPFRPGLVGGHCIGVDPYYLTHKANEVGYYPEMILAGRRLNDNMGSYVANEVSKLMIKKRIQIAEANILIMGLTFKENCPDHRNTRVVDLVKEFKSFSCNVDVYDPWVNRKQVAEEYKIETIDKPIKDKYDAIILAVSHDEFKSLTEGQIRAYGKDNHVLYDIKYLLKANQSDGRL